MPEELTNQEEYYTPPTPPRDFKSEVITLNFVNSQLANIGGAIQESFIGNEVANYVEIIKAAIKGEKKSTTSTFTATVGEVLDIVQKLGRMPEGDFSDFNKRVEGLLLQAIMGIQDPELIEWVLGSFDENGVPTKLGELLKRKVQATEKENQRIEKFYKNNRIEYLLEDE